MTSKLHNIPASPFAFLLSLLLLSVLSHAGFPTTTAIGISNSTVYTFSNWAGSNVSVTFLCIGGTTDCNVTAYCLDTANTCDPTANGTLYNGSITISTEGTSYIRYASNNSTGSWGDTGAGAVKIDTIAPSLSINDDASTGWANNDTISVSADDGNGSGISEARWIMRTDASCGTAQDSLFANNSTSSSGISMHADNESAYLNSYICFRAMDALGHRNYAASSKITKLDTTAPSVNAGADKVTNAQFTQTAAASDSASGVSAYAWSKVSGPGTVTFSNSNSATATISAGTDGTYVIRLVATDNAGNAGTGSFTLNWETSLPAITIANPGAAPAHSKAIEASVSKGNLSMAATTGTACDSSLSFVPYAPTAFSSESDNGKRICYRSIDSAGNIAYALSNAISGIDNTAPVITLLGISPMVVEVHGTYADAGAAASDNLEGSITSRITANGSVNTNVVGTYAITYSVADTAGNAAGAATRTVKVVDTSAPVMTLLGNFTPSVEIRSNYTDAGATATDNYDGSLTSKISVGGSVDTSKAGTYALTYDVKDSSGNRAVQLTRTVTVVDSLFPIIAGIGIIAAAVIVVGICAAAYFMFIKKKGGL